MRARLLHAMCRQIGCAVVVVGVLLMWSDAFAQQNGSVPNQAGIAQLAPSPEREALELQKLRRETDKLDAETKNLLAVPERERLERAKLSAETTNLSFWRQVLAPLATIVVATIALLGTIFTAAWAYTQAMDHLQRESEKKVEEKIHIKRMELYPLAIKRTGPLAIYFPGKPLSARVCAEMGHTLRKWYFDSGAGLYLSTRTRDSYFVLAAALTLAYRAGKSLKVPVPADRMALNSSSLGSYRKDLHIMPDKYVAPESLEDWQFGATTGDSAADKIRDYVLLQELSSRFRTALIDDLQTRRLPAGDPAAIEKPRASLLHWCGAALRRLFSRREVVADLTGKHASAHAAHGASGGPR